MTTPDSAAKAAAAIGRAITDLDPADAAAALSEALRKYSTALTPLESLRLVRAMEKAVKSRSSEISAAIIASVNGVPGKYNGFTIVQQDGRPSVNTNLLAEKYPDAFTECVTFGNPFFTVTLPRNQHMSDDPVTAAAKKASAS